MHRSLIKTFICLFATAGIAFADQPSAGTTTFSGACLQLSGNEVLSPGANVISWSVALYDRGGWANLGANPTRLTVPPGVSYVVVSMGAEVDKVAGQFNIRDDFNGSDSLIIQTGQQVIGDRNFSLSATTPALPVSAGDYFEYIAGTSGTISLLQSSSTYFCIRASP